MIQNCMKRIFYGIFFLFESFQEQIRDHVNDFRELKWKVNY